MNIVVTGASGFLGNAVVGHLIKQGHEVVAVDRHLNEFQNQFNIIIGDLCDLNFCDQIMAGAKVVIHLGAIPNPTDNRQFNVFANNTNSTFAVFSAAASAKVEKVIYASSIAIYGCSYSQKRIAPSYVPIDEDHPIPYEDSYAFSKNVNELSAKMWFELTGISFVGIRFPYLSNEENLSELIKQSQNKTPGISEILSKMFWSYLDLRDAVYAIEVVAMSRFKGAEVFNLAAPNTFVTDPTQGLVNKYFPDCRINAELSDLQSPLSSKKFITKFGYQPKYLLDKSKLALLLE